jgi:hypothetical protein
LATVIAVALGRGVKTSVGVQVGGNLKGITSCDGVESLKLLDVRHPVSSKMNNKEIKSILFFTLALNY